MPDPFRLDDKAALVTGGGRGLGRAMANALARAGADVVVVARREADLDETVAQVEAHGRRGLAVPGDVVDPGTATHAVDAAIREFGRVDALVNNAGLYHMQPIEDTEADDWRRVLEVNLMGAFHFCKAVARPFKAQGSGKVVNIASVLGTFGVAEVSAYCTAKAGTMGLTRALAVEWGPHGIQVNAIAPGLFRTDMSAAIFENEEAYRGIVAGIPRGTHAETSDIEGTAVYLCSPASDHVLGQVLHVDGGATIA